MLTHNTGDEHPKGTHVNAKGRAVSVPAAGPARARLPDDPLPPVPTAEHIMVMPAPAPRTPQRRWTKWEWPEGDIKW